MEKKVEPPENPQPRDLVMDSQDLEKIDEAALDDNKDLPEKAKAVLRKILSQRIR